MLLIASLAVGWHLAVFGIGKYLKSRRREISFEELLRLIERDLLESLKESLDKLPSEKRDEEPFSTWVAESETRLGRIEKDRK